MFKNWLQGFKELLERQKKFEQQSQRQLRLSLCFAIATALPVLIGVEAGAVGFSFQMSTLFALMSAAILQPSAVIISTFLWRDNQQRLLRGPNNLNYKLYLEGVWEDEQRELERLPVSDTEKKKLYLEAYKKHREKMEEVEAQIASIRISDNWPREVQKKTQDIRAHKPKLKAELERRALPPAKPDAKPGVPSKASDEAIVPVTPPKAPNETGVSAELSQAATELPFAGEVASDSNSDSIKTHENPRKPRVTE